jgi:hypothetical protein
MVLEKMIKNEVRLEIPHAQVPSQVLANREVSGAFNSPNKHKIKPPYYFFIRKNILLGLFQLISTHRVIKIIAFNA